MPLALLSYDELQEAEMVCDARIPVGMDRAGRNKQALSGMQRYRRLSIFLPNARHRTNAIDSDVALRARSSESLVRVGEVIGDVFSLPHDRSEISQPIVPPRY